MNFLRKIWLALAQPVRTVIRTAVRAEAERLLVEKVVPVVTEKIEQKLPGRGDVMTALIVGQIKSELRK